MAVRGSRLCALPALWVGLLYDQAALDAAWDLVEDWTPEEHAASARRRCRASASRRRSAAARCASVALDVLGIARAGLQRRARADSCGEDETHYLGPLFAIADSGRTPAEDLLTDFATRWHGDIDRIYAEQAY